jgi:UTP--glucose-1-phosphate uridylyltransferase
MKAIIPAAGLGSKFYPITKCVPKEMLPLHNKPIIHYVIQEALDSGITDIAIITRKGKTVIEDYIDLIPEFKNIYYIRQKEPLGLGDAILQAEGFIGNDPFAILLGDEIIETNSKIPHLKELMNIKELTFESVITIQKVGRDIISNYGVVDLGLKHIKYENYDLSANQPKQISYYDINGVTEKPSKENIKSDYSITGRYVLIPEIFKYLKQVKPSINNEIQLTDALDMLVKSGYTTYGLELDGIRWDVGNPEGYINYIKMT